MPSSHEIGGSIRYPAHDDVPMATDGDDISIHTTVEMEKYESLRHREFAHTHVSDVDILEGVGLDEELPTILQTYPSHCYPEPEPPPLPGTLFWSDTSVMGLTRLSAWWKGSDHLSNGWMTLQPCK
jgi:hypothetical protein